MSGLEKIFPVRPTGAVSFAAVFGGRAAAVLPLFLAPALAIWGLYAASHQAEVVENLRQRLEAESEFKAAQVETWLDERGREGGRLSRHPIFGGVLAQEIAAPGSRRRELETWLKEHLIQKQYVSLAFRAASGKVIAVTPRYSPDRYSASEPDFKKAVRECASRLTEVHSDPGGAQHIAMLIPMSLRGDCAGGTVGVLVINIDPEVKLYPLLAGRGEAMRTLLFRADGSDAVLMNGVGSLRPGQRLPLSTPELHAAAGLAGRNGFFESGGLAGKKVYAAVRGIQGRPWVVITEMDKGEALRSSRLQDYLALALLLLLALASHGIFAAVLREKQRASLAAVALSESRLRETMEQAVDGILTGSPKGLITGANKQMELLSGRSRAELLGQPVGMLFSPDELKAHPLRFDLLDAGQPVVLVRNLLRPDGTLVPVEMHSKRMADGSYQSIYRDISERQRAGQALRDSEAHFRSLYDATRDALMLLEAPDWKFASGNAAMRRVFGLAPDEDVSDWTPWKFSPPRQPDGRESKEKAAAMIEAALRNDSNLFEWQHCRKDGTEFPAEVQLTRVHLPGKDLLLANVRDITSRKTAEAALRRSEEKFRTLIEKSSIGVFIYQDLKITYANPCLEKMFGYEPGEVAGKFGPEKFMHPAELPGIMKLMVMRLAGVKQTEIKTYRGIRKDGGQILMELTSMPIEYQGRQALMGTVVDVTARKQAEEKLRDSNELFSMFMAHSPIYAFIKEVTPTESRVLQASENFKEMIGVPGSAMAGKTMAELFPAEFAAKITADDWAVASGGKVLNLNEELNGRSYTSIKFPIRHGGKTMMAGYTIDITERRRAEQALRESEARYRALFTGAVEGMLVADMEGRRFIYANQAICRMLGYTETELLGLSVADIHPKEALGQVAAVFEAQAQGKMQAADLPCLRKDGSVFYASISATKILIDGRDCVLGFFSDITERRRAEEALAASNMRLRSLWDHMGEGVALHDLLLDEAGRPVNYRLVEVNPRYLEILGLKRENVVGKLATEVYGTDPAPYLAEFGGVALSGKQKYMETYFPPMDKHLAISIAPWGRGGFAAIFTDITARKQGEIERQKLDASLADKTHEMENVLYITTHDLRGPLVNIQGFSSNLEKLLADLRELLGPAPGPDFDKILTKVPEALHFIRESSDRMDNLIRALLKVSRTGRSEMHPEFLDVGALASKIAASSKFRLEECGGTINISSLPCCHADAGAVDQILSNLVDNALKYRHPERPPLISITGELRGGRARYAVADNGAGIEPGDLKKVWDIFFRAEDESGPAGEGIGLTMARRLAEKNGGSMWAESEKGKGSVFHLELPYCGEVGK